jgi:long-chain acyl-CoA synthetase
MSDGFRWHHKARLIDSFGAEVPPGPPGSGVLPDSALGLAAAIGHPAFRIGAVDRPAPEPWAEPVFETLTSGSTGEPRRIRRTQGSWMASFAVNSGFGIGPGSRVAVLGRLVHSLSLYGAVEGLHLGAEVHLLDAVRPDRQSSALARRRITHLYATPAQLRLLTKGPGLCPDLQLILVGGSKLDATLRAGLADFAPQAEVREFYGAAEASFVALADASTPVTSVGRPYPGVELRLDPEGKIWMRSPYLFLNYADDGAALPANGAVWRDGWLSVGEVGSLDAGFLYLRGRAGRMVTVADQNVFPEEIELFLEALPGVTRAAVLPVPDPIRGHALVAILQGEAGQEAGILAALRQSLGPTRAPKTVIWREDWPVLASGKTDLKALEAILPWPA